MAIEHPVDEIQQQMQEAQQRTQGSSPNGRWASLLGAIALGLASLRRGGLIGAGLGLLTRTLTTRAMNEEADLDIVPNPPPNPWWRRFTRRQASIAKSEPLVSNRTGAPPTAPR
jgi:hypothetical protein